MVTDIAYNPIMWVGLTAAAAFMIVGIVLSNKAKKDKDARLDKKQGEIEKRKKPEDGV